MSDDPIPDSPSSSTTDLPTDLDRALHDADEETLRAVVTRVEALLDERARRSDASENEQGDGNTQSEGDETGGQRDSDEREQKPEWDADTERPDRRDAPPRATHVVKEINDNRYYYWQWRDGDEVRSEYIGPVDSA